VRRLIVVLMLGVFAGAVSAQEAVAGDANLAQAPVQTNTGSTWTSGVYSYDPMGNIEAIGTASAPGSQGYRTYGYDAVGRLTSAQIGGVPGAATNGYHYDAFGNRDQYGVNGQWVTVPVSAATNRLTEDVSYDAAGNQTRLKGTTATYDGFSMATSYQFDGVNAESFLYTASDERIGVLRGTAWTWSLRDDGGKVLRQYRSSSTNPNAAWVWVEDFVYRNGLLLASERTASQGGRRHYHLDHLGTPRLVTDAGGTVLAERDVLPFGEERTAIRQQGALGYDREEPLRFTGHERDFDTASPTNSSSYIDYMHARYYSAATGRFLSVDPVLTVNAMRSPQLWNRYAYVGNNPMNRIDPTGKVLQFAGTADDLEKVKQIANSGLNGYKMNINARGVASLSRVKGSGPETKEQKALRTGLQQVIGDTATTAIKVSSGAARVTIGSFDQKTIDPSDMMAYQTLQPSS
jgi:RHS repeat-associated protein